MAEGIDIIGGFNIKKKRPLDLRTNVADTTARLAIKWLYKGLIVTEADTQKRFLYIGNETSNLSGDWLGVKNLLSGTGAPAGSLGFIDDIYIGEDNKILYKKTGSTTWTALFTMSGASIYTVTGVPDNSDGLNGDISIRDDGGVYRKEAGVWNLKFNIAGSDGVDGQSDKYATTSATSIDLGTATAPLTITVGTGLNYTAGQNIVIASRANNANNIEAVLVSYNSGTGVLVANGLTINGTGTHTDWDVNLTGAPGATGQQGKAFIHTESNITLTQTKITTVEGGSYTPINPWSASVLNDTRSGGELTATAGITGSMVGNSIAYDGTNWYNNGQWRGAKGDKGDKGTDGANTVTVTNNNNYPYTRIVTSTTSETNTAFNTYGRYSVETSFDYILSACKVGNVFHIKATNNSMQLFVNPNMQLEDAISSLSTPYIKMGKLEKIKEITVLYTLDSQAMIIGVVYNEPLPIDTGIAYIPAGIMTPSLQTTVRTISPGVDRVSCFMFAQPNITYADVTKKHKIDFNFLIGKGAGANASTQLNWRIGRALLSSSDITTYTIIAQGLIAIPDFTTIVSFSCIDSGVLTLGTRYGYRLFLWSNKAAPDDGFMSSIENNIVVYQIPK